MIPLKNLKSLNTFGVDTYARYFASFETAADLHEIFSAPQVQHLPWYAIGGGSNLLLLGPYEGLMLQSSALEISVTEEDANQVLLCVKAGCPWDDFVAYCCTHGYYGAENLSYIPGSAGAAPVQNIGAYGVEAKDILHSVVYYEPATNKTHTINASACQFSYRDSIFKHHLKGKAIVLEVYFSLRKTPQFKLDYGDLRVEVDRRGGESLQNVRDAVVAIRQRKLPDPNLLGNAGSFFKNPVVAADFGAQLKNAYPEMPIYEAPLGFKLAAGWLIDRAGWKGTRKGEVGVHQRQALVLVNYGNATGGEILAFAQEICADVLQKFGVTLEMEVNIL